MANIEELRTEVATARGALEAGNDSVARARASQERVRVTAVQIGGLMNQITHLIDGPLKEEIQALSTIVAQAGQEYSTAHETLERIAGEAGNSSLEGAIVRSELSTECMRSGEEGGAAVSVGHMTENYMSAYERMIQGGTAAMGIARALLALDYHFEGALHHGTAGLEALRVYENQLGQ